MTPLTVAWADKEGSDDLAAFFVSHVDVSYISHGEIFCGRATSPTTWVDDLEAVVAKDLAGILSGADEGKRVMTAYRDGKLVALGIVALELDSPTPHAVLDDLIVDRAVRGEGIGRQALSSLEDLLRKEGATLVFLESGIDNHGAHVFFQRAGFSTGSVVMRKHL
jgi:ribosomal protein S18 acetylase RimI-like enzyme